ncbi:alpha-tocopherol transfer protein-like [Battus philenor]|uniref:alpha-tocopherol transfer protein-like n=1 Tax=Battus philenor TaxID=42288 RepID=UPI0035CF0A78
MDLVTSNQLIVVTDEDIEKTRLDNGIRNNMSEILDAIDHWCRKQEHLAEAYKYLERDVLERLLLLSGGSTEGAKKRIDKYLTSRGMMPEILLNRSIEEFSGLLNCIHFVPLPKLCPTDRTRVLMTQFLKENLSDFTILSYFRYAFMVGEYRLHIDYSLGERYVVDLANVNISLISKLNPIVLKKAEILCVESFGTKIKGIHILNAPPFVDKLVFILKQALREKVASRVHVHSSYEDLYKHIPKEILPRDYGGDEASCNKLAMQWRDLWKSQKVREMISKMDHLVSDETKRDTTKFNEEYLGIPGSFRKLSVD